MHLINKLTAILKLVVRSHMGSVDYQ